MMIYAAFVTMLISAVRQEGWYGSVVCALVGRDQ
jgi:hypothetical protein